MGETMDQTVQERAAPRAERKRAAAGPAPTPVTEPDLIDRIFEMLVARYPGLTPEMGDLKAHLRAEFRGERVYVNHRSAAERQAVKLAMAAEFNGRNAHELARLYNCSVPTVYRYLKQARLERRACQP